MSSIESLPTQPMRAVYTYPFPEVREVVKAVQHLPKKENLMLTETPISEAQEIIQGLGFTPTLDLPEKDGKIDLDSLPWPVIDRICQRYKEKIPGLDTFPYRYPTAGSSEGIFHALSRLRSNGKNEIYTLPDEYEGYSKYGEHLGFKTKSIDIQKTRPKDLPVGNWFISNPNSSDGNVLEEEVVQEILDAGHSVALDLAYVGTTPSRAFPVTHENIDTVFLSLSKPYGLFRYRIGFTFSRKPIDTLYANTWFHNTDNLLIALKTIEDIGPEKLYPIYAPTQEKIVSQIQEKTQIPMKKSDVLLLGHLPVKEKPDLSENQTTWIEQYRRGDIYRFCLTPFFVDEEKKASSKT